MVVSVVYNDVSHAEKTNCLAKETKMDQQIKFSVIIPDSAKVVREVEDYIFENANSLVGMSFNKIGWADFVGGKFNVNHLDVFRTVQYMVNMDYLIEDGVFGNTQLWQVNPEYLI